MRVRTLLWLRWTLLVRSFSREPGRIIGAVLLLLCLLPFAVGISVGTFFAYRYLPRAGAVEILFLVLTALTLFWLVAPIFLFNLNEGLDASRLVSYPLARAELMLGLLLGSLLDIPAILAVFVLAAVVAGWATSLLALPFALLGVLIAYTQMIAASQLLLTALGRLLSSRRMRDITTVVFALLGMSCYFVSQILSRLFSALAGPNLREVSISPWLQWTPPGLAARGIERAAAGDYLLSLAWLTLAALAAGALIVAWRWLLERSLTAGETGGAARRGRRTQPAPPPVPSGMPAGRERGWLPPAVQALAIKDLRYFWRDPQLKVSLLSKYGFLLFFLVTTVLNRRGGGAPSWAALWLPLLAAFDAMTLAFNMFGWERRGLGTLFLFPTPPRQILRGKNLAIAALALVETLIWAVVLLVLTASELVVPALVVSLGTLAVTLAAGNLSSVLRPYYVPANRRGGLSGSSSERGFASALWSFLLLGIVALLLLPLAAVVIVPWLLAMAWLWVVAVPVGLLYAGVLYRLSLGRAADLLARREPEIFAICAKE